MPRLKTKKTTAQVGDLLLDVENPRTGSVNGQPEALEAIINLHEQHFRNMMVSIKAHELDPGDSFYVIDNHGEAASYVVVDGNRRLAALKVLNNPDLLDGTKIVGNIKKRLREAAGSFSPIQPISCVVFGSREDANEWIERRHGKGLDGEGRIPWGALESERFQKDGTVLDVIGFVERNSTFETAIWQRIKISVEKSPTTLRRFLVSKAGKQALGFVENYDGAGPAFRQEPGHTIAILSQLFSDIDAGAVNSRSHNKASEIKAYFEGQLSQLGAEEPVDNAPLPFKTTDLNDAVKRPRRKTNRSAANSIKAKGVTGLRSTLAPAKHQFAEPSEEKGKQLLREASKLKLIDTPLGCAFLFRAIIEFAIMKEMRKSGLPEIDNKGEKLDLKGRFNSVAEYLIKTNGRLTHKNDLNAIKTTLNAKTGSMTISSLNGYIHNHFQKPSPDDLRNAWDHAVPLFLAIFGNNS